MIDVTPEEETAARALCAVSGYNPDAIVSFGEPERGPKGRYYAPREDHCCPAWQLYVMDIRAAVRLLKGDAT
jgi:hypothetical protein